MPQPVAAQPAKLDTGVADGNDLARLFDQPEESIDLGRAALLLARAEYPEMDVQAEVGRLDVLAAQAAPYLSPGPDAAGRLGGLRAFLAEVCGFRGNEQDYYDPKNSFLNRVLDSRTGIPITLSVVYMEIGRRLGLPLKGVGLPGHFLVKYQDPGNVLFLDPFNGGRTVTSAECREMVTQMYQGRIPFQEEFLAGVSKKYIVLRMLNNLRGIYLQNAQLRKALAVVEMILAISPASGEDLKQRGVIHYRLQNYKQARQDLETYLFLNPGATDSEAVKETLHDLQRVSAMLN
jgi:regulator of sirC expression with transglutaminase-like and TPR domain